MKNYLKHLPFIVAIILFSDLTHETELSPNPVTTVAVSFINDLRFIKFN